MCDNLPRLLDRPEGYEIYRKYESGQNAILKGLLLAIFRPKFALNLGINFKVEIGQKVPESGIEKVEWQTGMTLGRLAENLGRNFKLDYKYFPFIFRDFRRYRKLKTTTFSKFGHFHKR